jgi:hypothetical protein
MEFEIFGHWVIPHQINEKKNSNRTTTIVNSKTKSNIDFFVKCQLKFLEQLLV